MAKTKELNPEVAQEKLFTVTEQGANSFLQVLGIMLVGDDRLKPLQQHFVTLINQGNAENTEQPPK